MKQKELIIKYQTSSLSDLNDTDKELIKNACNATFNSYAPYSNFHVGAALLLSNNKIIQGSNQENAAFGAGTCAERCAMFYANARYPEESITTIAISARGTNGDFTESPISPCGICRQALLEAQIRAKQPIKVLLYGKREILTIDSISDLLPIQFDEIV